VRKLIIIKTGNTMSSLKAARGDFEDWILAGMGVEARHALVVDVAEGQTLPRPENDAAIVITGSHDMVSDRLEWSERTAAWLASAVSHGAPILGICYGHQLLAHALGGDVNYNPRGQEMGTTEVTVLAEASTDPLLRGLPEAINVHVSHSQSVLRLPPGALRLAGNDWDRNQAFRVGDCAWGVQFHPEFDAEIMRAYAAKEGSSAEIRIFDTPIGSQILGRFATLALGSTEVGLSQSVEIDGR